MTRTRAPRRASAASAPRLAQEPAYVLHQHDWSESSLIVDLFTRSLGRVAVAAKGAKRPYSQLRGVLLPFQRILVGASGDAEVRTLKSAEWGAGPAGLPPQRLLLGFYANELLVRLLAREDPHPALFDLYDQLLLALAQREPDLTSAQEQAALRAFEIGLLDALGVLPALTRVTSTQQALQDEAWYGLDAEHGVVARAPAAPAEASLPGRCLNALAQALTLAEPQARFQALVQAVAPHLQPLRAQGRELLHYHLGSPLRTRALMLELAAS